MNVAVEWTRFRLLYRVLMRHLRVDVDIDVKDLAGLDPDELDKIAAGFREETGRHRALLLERQETKP